MERETTVGSVHGRVRHGKIRKGECSKNNKHKSTKIELTLLFGRGGVFGLGGFSFFGFGVINSQ